MSGILAWLLPGVPVAVGAVLAVLGRRGAPVARSLAVGTLAVTVVLALTVAADAPAVSAPFLSGLPIRLGVDPLSGAVAVTVAVVAVLVVLFATGEPALESPSRFFGLMCLFTGAMLLTVTAASVLPLLIGFEVMGAASWALIGFWYTDPVRVEAAHVAFLTTRATDLGMYLAAGALYAGGGTLDLDRLAGLPSPWLHLAAAGLVVAALGKSAQLPFSFWLSRAMSGPSPVSALLHSATLVAAGAYLLLRVQPLLGATSWAGPLVAWVGALTALGLGLVALAQHDLKQLLAASTCAQLGFVLVAAGTGSVAAGAGQLIAHAAVKSLAFVLAGALLTALGTKDLRALVGAGRSWPAVGMFGAVGLLALAGAPPLSLWLTKDAALAGALSSSAALYGVGLAAAAVSAAYAGKALVVLLAPLPAAPEPGYDSEERGSRNMPRRTVVAMVPLAVASVVLGVLAVPELSRRLAAGGEPPVAVPPPELVVSGLLAAVVLGVAGWRYPAGRSRPLPLPSALGQWAGGWLGLEPAARAVVVRPTLLLAGAVASFDDRFVDAGVRGSAWLGRQGGRVVTVRVEVTLDGLVRAVAAGARRLGGLARRPQTGQVHQYYAQALVLLLALAVTALAAR